MGESGSETGSAIAWEIFACLRVGRSLGKCNLGKGDLERLGDEALTSFHRKRQVGHNAVSGSVSCNRISTRSTNG